MLTTIFNRDNVVGNGGKLHNTVGVSNNRKFSRENHSSSMKFNMKFDFRIVCGPIVHWNKPKWWIEGAAGVAWIDIGHKFPLGR